MAGTFTPSMPHASPRREADGVGLVMAGAVLTLVFYRKGSGPRKKILVDNPARLYAF